LDYRDYVRQDQRFYRPAEVDQLVANPSRAHATLGWRPRVDFASLVQLMVDADLKRLGKDIG
jgi:GDPmannose 4,6-dehydratase